MITYEEATRKGAQIAARLRALGVDLKTNHSLQAVAAYNDFPDWNRFVASLERNKTRPKTSGSNELGPRSPLPAVDRSPKLQLIAGTIGSGKSTVAVLRLLQEARITGATPLFILPFPIDVATCEMPESFFARAMLIEVLIDPETATERATIPRGGPTLSDPSCIVVGMRLSTDELRNGAFTPALGRLPEMLKQIVRHDLLEAIKLIVIDEAHRFYDAALYRSILPRFAAGGAEVLAVSQLIPELLGDPSSNNPFTSILVTDMPEHLGTKMPVGAIYAKDLMLADRPLTLIEQCAGYVYTQMQHESCPEQWTADFGPALTDILETQEQRRRARREAPPAATRTPEGPLKEMIGFLAK